MSTVKIAALPDLQAFRAAAGEGTDGYVKLDVASGVKSTGGGFFQKLIGKPSEAENRRVREALFSAMSASTGDNMLLKLAIENVRNELGLGPSSDPKIGNKPLLQRELKMILDNFDGAKAGTEAVMKKTKKAYVDGRTKERMTYGEVMTQMRPELRKVYASQYAYGADEINAFREKIDACLARNGGLPTAEAAELVLDEFKEWTNIIPGRLIASDLSEECRSGLMEFENGMRKLVEELRDELKAGTKSPCDVMEKLVDAFAAQKSKLAEVKEDLVRKGCPDQAKSVVSSSRKDKAISADFNHFLQAGEAVRDVWRRRTDIQTTFGASIDNLPITDENDKKLVFSGIEDRFQNGDLTFDAVKENLSPKFWTTLGDGIRQFEQNRSAYAQRISNHFSKFLPAEVAKAMADQLCGQIRKYYLFFAAANPDKEFLLGYAKECVDALTKMGGDNVRALCPMFKMTAKEDINSYLKDQIRSGFAKNHDDSISTESFNSSSTKNKVNHLAVREYCGKGTVLFDGETAEVNAKAVDIPKMFNSLNPGQRKFYKFMSGKFDDDHQGVSRLLTFCLSTANGIGGIGRGLFLQESSRAGGRLRKGMDNPFAQTTHEEGMELGWDLGSPGTYEINTDKEKNEIVLTANVNLSPLIYKLPGGTSVHSHNGTFAHGLLKNTAQVRIRIKNTNDATLKKEKKIHPDFEVEILSQKVSDLDGKEIYDNQ